MTDKKLDELEAACRVQPDADGTIKLHPGHVLDV